MDNLPMIQEKLNIFQKIKLKFYQVKKYGKWFENAPSYIKNDEKILKKMIKKVLQSSGFIGFKGEKKFILEIFRNNPNLFDGEDRSKIIEIIKRRSHDEKIMSLVSNLTLEEQEILIDELDEYLVYPFISIEEAKYLINNNTFKFYQLARCKIDIQVELMKEHKELISKGSSEAQTKYLEANPSDFELANDSGKITFLSNNPEYLSQHPEYTKKLAKEIQMEFATQNKNNLKFLKEDYQIEIIDNHPNAFLYITEDMKRMIFDNPENASLLKKIINYDYKNSKYLLNNYDVYNNYYLRKSNNGELIGHIYLESLTSEINSYNSKQLEELFFKSGIIYARGTLRNYGHGYQDGGYTPSEPTIDIFSPEEIKLVQELSIGQIAELIKIDSNYILPYIENANTRFDQSKRIDKETETYYKQRCKDVFKVLFGDNKLKLYDKCIDNIFEASVNFEDRDLHDRKEMKKRQTQFPLESLKLLFNEKILTSNTPEMINEYYTKLLNGENVKELFFSIIYNAYGEKALQILNERKDLDVYNINSLEIFDDRILNNFSPAFVNDLLSYNIVEVSSFFNIVKDDNDLKLFKKYYEVLSKVFGKNVETMQKAISEYYYVDELLKNIDIENLSEKQFTSFLSCICGNRNEFNINTLEELDKFDEIANQQFLDEINLIDKYHSNGHLEVLKQKIFSNFFGLNIVREFELIDELSEEEKEIIQCVNFIYWEKSEEKLKDLIQELLKNPNIRNPIAVHTAINKIKEKTRLEPLKKRLLLKEDLDLACGNLKNEGKIRREQADNITIYYLTGIDFSSKKVLEHNTWNANGRDIMESESQLGMSTVSTYYANFGNDRGRYLFTDIEAEDLIGVNYQDSGTSHVPKVVRASRSKWE